MAIPYFYLERAVAGEVTLVLDEDTSRHIIQVLRMEAGEKLRLTDGNGNLHTAEIIQVHKKSTQVKILTSDHAAPAAHKIGIAISLIKNASRFEWFLEKATEIGVTEIIPLICDRTEKHHFRLNRAKSILVSALLQSQQTWLPAISAPVLMTDYLYQCSYGQRFIAYCVEGDKRTIHELYNREKEVVVLIGPEGDFSQPEIDLALQHAFIPITLGETRLRTETAGIVAASLLKNL